MKKILAACAGLVALAIVGAHLSMPRHYARDYDGTFTAMPFRRPFLSLIGEANAARNGSGTFSLYTPGNPVVTATTISSTWANNTLSDLATEMTDSLNRSGKGGMLAALRLTNGTVGAPSLSFTSETNSGLFRSSAGHIRMAIGGTYYQEWTAGTTSIVSGTSGQQTNAVLNIQDTDGYGLFTIPRLTAGSVNSLVQANDTGLFFGHAIDSTDGLVIGPWSASSKGLRIASTGAITTSGGFTVGNLLTVSTGGATITGGITLPDVGPTIATTGTQSTLTIKGNRQANDSGTDIVLASSATRVSQGTILAVKNNATNAALVDYLQRVLLYDTSGVNQIIIDPTTGATTISMGGAGAQITQVQTFLMTATLQANLGTPGNGTLKYCSDCTIANPCAGSGNGALAKRLNGAWVCN